MQGSNTRRLFVLGILLLVGVCLAALLWRGTVIESLPALVVETFTTFPTTEVLAPVAAEPVPTTIVSDTVTVPVLTDSVNPSPQVLGVESTAVPVATRQDTEVLSEAETITIMAWLFDHLKRVNLRLDRQAAQTSDDAREDVQDLEKRLPALIAQFASTTGTTTVVYGTSTATSTFTSLTITGPLYDQLAASGTAGMVLQSTGVGVVWVATSSLGITGGGGGGGVTVSDFDTSSELASILGDETGSGSVVFGTSPTLVTPNLGTPSAAVLTNATGLPIATGVSGLGTNVATFLTTPSSVNFASTLTDETGTGSVVLANNPTLTGTVAAGNLSLSGILTAGGTTTLSTTTMSALRIGSLSGLVSAVNGFVSSIATSTLGVNLGDTVGTLGGTRGGTGLTSVTQNQLLIGGAGNTWTQVATSSLGFASSFSNSAQLAGILADESGTGVVAYTTNPVFTTPNLGTPSAATLTNATGLPISTGLTGAGTGVLTALAVNVGTAGSFITNGGALGTPSSGTLTNATGLPITTGVAGLGANVATFLETPSSANLASAVTGETGSGNLVFSASPTFTGTAIFTSINMSGGLTIGGDIALTRGAANRLDLASGDILNLISGSISIGNIPVIDAARRITTATGTIGSGTLAFSFANDGNTGVYSSAPNTLDFVTDGFRGLSINPDWTITLGKPSITAENLTPFVHAESIPFAGNANTLLGQEALSLVYNSGTLSNGYNTAIGMGALKDLISGRDNVALGSIAMWLTSTSSDTIAIGNGALINIPVSLNNIAIGTDVGGAADIGANNNILIGHQAADNLTTGNNNIIIGYDIDSVTATADNVLNIGNLIFGNGLDGTGTTLASGNIGIGTSTPTSRLTVAGTFSATATSTLATTTIASLSVGNLSGLFLGTNGNVSAVATSSLGLSAAFTNSSQLGALLSDESGTGAVAFTNSPTLTGTTNFTNLIGTNATTTNLAVTSLSANQVPYIANGRLTGGLLTYDGTTLSSVAINTGTLSRGSLGLSIMNNSFATSGTAVAMTTGTFSHSAGALTAVAISPTYNQSGTAAATDLLINRTETAVGTGAQNLFDAQVGGVSRFLITNSGNVGIGTTSPSGRLAVVGNTFIGGNLTTSGTLSVLSNSALSTTTIANRLDAPGLRADSTTGILFTNQVAFAGNNIVNVNNIDASGNLINTGSTTLATTTMSRLRLSGAFLDVTNSAGLAGMVLQSTGTSTRWVATSSLGIAGGSSLFTDGGATTYLTSLTDNLSIGTTASLGLLTVSTTSSNAALAIRQDGTGNLLSVFDGAASAFSIFDGGNVAIGTTSALRRLSVFDPGNLVVATFMSGLGDAAIDVDSTVTGDSFARFLDAGVPQWSIGNENVTDSFNISSSFNLTTTPRLTILNSGNVGIGTTTPDSRLTVSGTMGVTGTSTLATTTIASLSVGNLSGLLLGTNGAISSIATSTLNINLANTTGTLAANRGGTGLASFGGTNTVLYTTVANSLASSPNFTFNGQVLGVTGSTTASGGYFVNTVPVATASSTRNNFYFAGATASSTMQNTGSFNFAFGTNALNQLAAGSNNVAIGNGALQSLLSATSTFSDNVAIGRLALRRNTTGNGNFAVGATALNTNQTGSDNIAFGNDAMISNISGSGNIGLGSFVLTTNQSGSNNVSLGSGSMILNRTGSDNVAIGNSALYGGRGSGTIAIGFRAAYDTASTSRGIFIGYDVQPASTTENDVLNIGNLIFGNNVNGTGTTISTGNVGIGTATPTSRLTVAGTFSVIGTSTLATTTISSLRVGTLSGLLLGTAGNVSAIATSTLGIALGDTTGTLAVARGGTGVTSFGSANTVLFTSAANTLASSTNFTFTGTNLALGGTTGLQLGGDVLLNRGATNRLDLASGDSLNVVSGNLLFGGTAFITASSGNSSIVFGELAGATFNILSTNNIAIGFEAGRFSSTSNTDYNVFVGSGAGRDASGDSNIIIGDNAGMFASTSASIIMGTNAGGRGLSENIAIGSNVGDVQGSYNILMGARAGQFGLLNDSNIVMGNYSGVGAEGSRMIVLGDNTGYFYSGTSSVVIGDSAGSSGSGMSTVLIGNAAGNTNAGDNVIAIGLEAGYSNIGRENIFLGSRTGSENVGSFNSIVGFQAGRYLRSTSSVVFGAEALFGHNGGSGQQAFTAVNNVALGYRAGYNATNSANNNILLGYQAADNLTTGNNNIIIGYDIDNVTATADNVLNIGNIIFGNGLDGTGTTLASGNIGIGTSTLSTRLTVDGAVTASNLFGGVTTLSVDANGVIIRTPSDERLKTNIEDLDSALEKVLMLRGVRYEWQDQDRFGTDAEVGFLAQEVERVIPEVVRKNGEYWTLNTPNLLSYVVEAIKEVWNTVTAQGESIDQLEIENASLRARIERLEAAVGNSGAGVTTVPPSQPDTTVNNAPSESSPDPVPSPTEPDVPMVEVTTESEPQPETTLVTP